MKGKEDARDGTRPYSGLYDGIARFRAKPRQVFLQRNSAVTGIRGTERSENELCALLAEFQQCVEDVIELQEKPRTRLPVQNEEGKNELKEDAPDDNPPWKAFAVFG